MQPALAKSIGLVIQDAYNPYYDDIIIGVQQAATLRGYNVLVVSSERTSKLERQLVELLIAKDVEGLIIDPLLNDESDLSHLFEIKQRNIPFVLLGHLRGIQASVVNVDHVAASEAVVEYITGRGHKQILHTALDYFRDRTEDRPTAVTCYNDLLALGLIRALRELGLRGPTDVSVIGYDDIDMAGYASIPLTTVPVPKGEMGRQAAEMLIKHIETYHVDTIEKVCLQAGLIARESVRALLGHMALKREDSKRNLL